MQTNLAWETLFDVSAQSDGPLHVRLTGAIRGAIRDGRLPLGAALPPSRMLAADLGVSRWAVTQAYGQLVTEGYLTSRTGSATRVTWSPKRDDDRFPRPAKPAAAPVRFDLSMCMSDLRAFPRRKWVEAIRNASESTPFDQLSYAAPGGEPRLRAILAEHLNRSRGAAAEPAALCVFSGARASIGQVARALFEEGHRQVGMEDPGSPGLWPPVRAAGLEVVPLPVDRDGLITGALDEHPGMRAVCVGAARQILLGRPLAPHRRAEMLEWAKRVDGLIIEDDYDSEFSYEGQALPVMQGSDRRRVALLGSMSRTLTPTAHVGWVIAPPRMVAAIAAEHNSPLAPPALIQLALASFMESGEYDRHLRASRQRFRARRNALLAALRDRLPDYPVHGSAAGIHMLLELPPEISIGALVKAANRRDMDLCDPAEMRLLPTPDYHYLPIGYANLNDAVVDEAIATLAGLLADPAVCTPRPLHSAGSRAPESGR